MSVLSPIRGLVPFVLMFVLVLSSSLAHARASNEFESHADASFLDHVNRQTMHLNNWLVIAVVDPLVRGYNWTVPKWGQRRVSSVLRNLAGPRDVANSLLQAKVNRASVHLARFVADSIFGVAGLFEIGEPVLGLRAPPETFSETLGVYSVGPGPFLIVPLFGETCTRGLAGAVADSVLYPLSWLPPAGVANPVGVGGRMMHGMGSLSLRMPARGASRESWNRYENLRDALITTPYAERKRLFYENDAWDVSR